MRGAAAQGVGGPQLVGQLSIRIAKVKAVRVGPVMVCHKDVHPKGEHGHQEEAHTGEHSAPDDAA